METILKVQDLKTYFFSHEGIVRAVNEVNFMIRKGETLGLVGESGSGKSVTALSIMRLVPEPHGKIVHGKIFFEDQDLLDLDLKQMRRIRGKKISMIFQEPMTSLDPVFTIGHEITEAIRIHQGFGKKKAREKTLEILELVGFPDPKKRIDNYPHELSGGMRQRAMIAMALSCNPHLLIADEPTTALDVTIQAQILRLINDMKETFGASVLLITHDLGVVAKMCDSVAVMYAGTIVEYADVFSLFKNPLHPYTQGLRASIPRIDTEVEKLDTIRGSVPDLRHIPSGCPFHPRCALAEDKCAMESPPLMSVHETHYVMCHLMRGN